MTLKKHRKIIINIKFIYLFSFIFSFIYFLKFSKNQIQYKGKQKYFKMILYNKK